MRNYWLKIVLGALGIFAVGMIIRTIVRAGHDEVMHVVETSDPISIPVAFVPFKLDGERLGTIRRITILRDQPKRPTAVEFSVRMSDSVSARLADCFLTVDRLEKLDENSTFTCLKAADTTGRGLVPFGAVVTSADGDGETGRFVMLLPDSTIRELQADLADGQRYSSDSVEAAVEADRERSRQEADSIREAAGVRADSIMQSTEALRDSIERRMEIAESIRVAGHEAAAERAR
jgi:hypothetical protein